MATFNRTFSVKNGIDVANTLFIDSGRNLVNIANISTTGSVNVGGNIDVTGNLIVNTDKFKVFASNGDVQILGDVSISGGDLISTTSTVNVFNTTTTTVNFGGLATTLNVGSTTGNTIVRNNLTVNKNATVSETTTANNFVSTRTALSAPSTTSFDGERIRLYDFQQAGHPNYAIGVEGSHIWMGVDDVGPTLGFKWYGNTTQVALLRTNSTFELSNTILAKNFITTAGLNVTDQANAAYAQANAAYAEANLKLNLTGGSLTGSLNISGNLTVTGNTTFINVATYSVDDSLILLGANNTLTDLVDIGFVATRNNGTTTTHTGFARDANDASWYVFDNLSSPGHQNNVLDFANSTYGLLRANLYAQQLNVVNGFVNVATTLTVSGNTTLANVDINQDANVKGNLFVVGTTVYSNTVTYTSAVNVNSTLNVTGNTNLTNLVANGAVTINSSGVGLTVANATVTHTLNISSLQVTTNTVTTSTSGQVVLDTYPLTSLASAKYFVQANSSTDYHTTELITVHDGTNIYLTEYGSVQTGPSLGTFTADINSGNVRLLFTATNNINTIRSARYGLIP